MKTTSQRRNSKFRFHILTVGLAVVLCAACHKDNTSASSNQPASIYGNVSSPDWVVDSLYDYNSSMTAVVTVSALSLTDDGPNIEPSIDESDLLAAFCGEECLGTASPDDEGRFFLFIQSPSNAGQQVNLLYYSAHYRNIFLAETPIAFVGGAQCGTSVEPMDLRFVVKD